MAVGGPHILIELGHILKLSTGQTLQFSSLFLLLQFHLPGSVLKTLTNGEQE